MTWEGDADTHNYDTLGRISRVIYDVTMAIAEDAQSRLAGRQRRRAFVKFLMSA